MNVLGIDVLNGALAICVVYIGFSLMYILNMVGGVIINVQIEKIETFSWRQFLLSFEKVLFCGVAIFACVVATNLVAQGLFKIDEQMSEMVTGIVSIGTFALVFAKGFLQKVSNLVDKIKYMLEIDSSNDIDKAKIEEISQQSYADLEFNADLEPNEEEVG